MSFFKPIGVGDAALHAKLSGCVLRLVRAGTHFRRRPPFSPHRRPLMQRQRPLAILGALCFAGGGLSAQSPMLSAIRSLGLSADSGDIMVYYSAGQLTRAKQIRALADPMAAYYRTKLGVSARISFAVIDSASWARIPARSLPGSVCLRFSERGGTRGEPAASCAVGAT